MAGEEFITIKLSDAGAKFAGEAGIVRINNSRREFTFKTGETQKVLRAYEWSHILSPMQAEGEAMFEVVEQHESEIAPTALERKAN